MKTENEVSKVFLVHDGGIASTAGRISRSALPKACSFTRYRWFAHRMGRAFSRELQMEDKISGKGQDKGLSIQHLCPNIEPIYQKRWSGGGATRGVFGGMTVIVFSLVKNGRFVVLDCVGSSCQLS